MAGMDVTGVSILASLPLYYPTLVASTFAGYTRITEVNTLAIDNLTPPIQNPQFPLEDGQLGRLPD